VFSNLGTEWKKLASQAYSESNGSLGCQFVEFFKRFGVPEVSGVINGVEYY